MPLFASKGKSLNRKLIDSKKKKKTFRISLRYKFAFPVLMLVIALIFILFRTTFHTVRDVVTDRNERRLQTITEIFAETIKVPLILHNQQVLIANIEWMAKRPDVLEARVEDSEGVIVGGGGAATYMSSATLERNFIGVRRIASDVYAVAVPIRAHDRRLGRVLILFSQQGFEEELRQIFEHRLMLAFIMAFFLALLIAGITWLAIRPLFVLKKTVQDILSGDLTARARINSYDEIQDLGEAFNEMVARLGKSLDNLRSRTEALEESEEKYRLIVENASDIILTLTPEGEIALLNKEFSGCSRDEMMLDGLPLLLSLFDLDSRKKFEVALERVCKMKQPEMNLVLTQVHRQKKDEIFYLMNLTPMLDHEGNVKFIQGVMRDITELRRIEMMKESLIRDVAHELKTPTAKFDMAVGWFEKEVEKNHQTTQYKQIIDILKSNTDRLMRTITSIMDLSKLESGMTRLDGADLDLNKDVLEPVRLDMEPICKQRNVQLECVFSKEPLMMKGDRDMLYRLFVNLIGNAAKFTESGKIIVTSHKEKGRVCVTVKDTGIGIEKAFLEKIFDRFVQKTASSTGIGVGLTISRDIALLHHGKVWAESEGLGKGAQFKVEFPSIEKQN
jgi:PAS domain S-box-containing protein